MGRGHRAVAETTRACDFDELRIRVKNDVLLIERPRLSWLSFRSQRGPARARGSPSPARIVRIVRLPRFGPWRDTGRKPDGQFVFGQLVYIAISRSDALVARSSWSSRLHISGTCQSIRVQASSGAKLDAEGCAARMWKYGPRVAAPCRPRPAGVSSDQPPVVPT